MYVCIYLCVFHQHKHTYTHLYMYMHMDGVVFGIYQELKTREGLNWEPFACVYVMYV